MRHKGGSEKCTICLNGFPEGKERKKKTGTMCEVIMAENFSNR